MAGSIFDPNSPEVEHSGSRNLAPPADEISDVPDALQQAKIAANPDQPDTSPELEQIAEDQGKTTS